VKVSDLVVGASGSSCAVVDAGGVKCWGENNRGQLGDATFVDTATPVDVRNLGDVTRLAVGPDHACALTPAGAVRCWGANDLGQLGDWSRQDQPEPVFAVTVSGATQLAASIFSNCALTGGTVRCWGYGGSGQLGNMSFANSLAHEPVTVSTIADATAISAGVDHTCAIVESGKVKCWGYNVDGELGNGDTANRADPVYVRSIDGATALSAGDIHTCAVVAGGAVKCWGGNRRGQLGNAAIPTGRGAMSTTPVDVTGPTGPLTGALSVVAGNNDTCAMMSGGTIQCWGDNSGNLLLGPDVSALLSAEPHPYPGVSAAAQVGVGDSFICVRVGGGVKCWGRNNVGQLGDRTYVDRDHPAAVRF
jgi:alpha-tubulin suppressor-like RCC1 family protein